MAEDDRIRQHVYEETARRGRPPGSDAVADALAMPVSAVRAAYRRLAARRLLVLAPESGEIVMAPPFSAVSTPFRVRVGERSYFANCVWDALGIPAALHEDGDVEASCACCGEPMVLEVRGGRPTRAPGVAHFAVPAAHWWDDIVFT